MELKLYKATGELVGTISTSGCVLDFGVISTGSSQEIEVYIKNEGTTILHDGRITIGDTNDTAGVSGQIAKSSTPTAAGGSAGSYSGAIVLDDTSLNPGEVEYFWWKLLTTNATPVENDINDISIVISGKETAA